MAAKTPRESPHPPSLSPHNSTPQANPLRVVAIGGGTGLSTLLRGLKQYVASPISAASGRLEETLIRDLAAIVTVTDDGGSSGRLRKDFNILPPGDLRNCMVALSEDEQLITRLFRHRFRGGEGLEGHSFGNLFVAALAEITGDFAQAIKLSSQVLATRGHIYPATVSNVALQRADGRRQHRQRRNQHHRQQAPHRPAFLVPGGSRATSRNP